MENKKLQAYARLIVRKGLNPDQGQDVIITAGLDQPDFVRMVVKECYDCGVRKVIMNWTDQAIARLAQIHQDQDSLSEFMPWEKARWQWITEKLPARLWLDSDDPDGMNGIDTDKYAAAISARMRKIKPYRDAIESRHQWCIAAVPSRPWAEKIFPDAAPEEAEEKLWEAILSSSRALGDPIANWNEHNRNIADRTAKMNAFHFAALEYKSANGTDFRIGLLPNGVFAGAEEKDLLGRPFNPNIPSEEIFTAPRRGDAEGTVVSTKPLSWQGSLIENFSIRFSQGKAVELHAEKGLDVLKKIISIDEGASYLGECALVPFNSPINNSGILFYNTLFDENASCHLALGAGYPTCVQDYEKYTLEQIHEMGVNESNSHVDFMIGAADLNITGITQDGQRIPVFKNGEWCF